MNVTAIDYSEISSLSDLQDRILSILPIVPALLSCICSSILLQLTKSRQAPYQRILFGLSVSDLFTSVSFVLQPFLVPQETSQRVWASGNDGTCTAIGFLSQLTTATLLYNGFLSFYFFMTIRFAVSDTKFWSYEKYLHGVCVLYPLGTATVGAIIGVYHEVELGPGCWVNDWPEGQYQHLLLCAVAADSIDSTVHESGYAIAAQLVRSQAFLYVTAFWGTFIFTVILRVMESLSFDAHDEDKLFPLLVLQAIMVTSTGIFNLLIFARPKYLRIRKDHANQSRCWAWRLALFGDAETFDRQSFFTFLSRNSSRGSFFRRNKQSGETAEDSKPPQLDLSGDKDADEAVAPEEKPGSCA